VAKAAGPSSGGGGKKTKKKWSKGKVKDKAVHAVTLDQPTYDRIFKEVPNYRLISVSTLVDRFKIGGALARVALRDLADKGVIREVDSHSKQLIYTRAVTATD